MPTTNFANVYDIYRTTQWPDVTTNTVYYTNAITPTATINTTATGTTTTWAVPAAWANVTANDGWMHYYPDNTNGPLWQQYDPVAVGTALKDVLSRLANEMEEPEESEIIELLGE